MMNMLKTPKSDDAAAAADVPERSPNGFLARLRSLLSGKARTGGMKASLDDMIQAAPAASGAARDKARQMLDKLMSFSRLRVDDVLVPRAGIIAMEAGQSLAEMLELFTSAQHSRLPIYRETLDDPIGMVHIKDLLGLLKARAEAADKADPAATAADMVLPGEVLAMTVEDSGLLRPLLFAPPSMPAGDLLVKMQSTHLHMAIIVDEYGGAEGLVTIEDLVEEIVGEIADEHDEEEQTLITPVPGGYVVSARAAIEDLEALLKTDLLPPEQDEETGTVGGLIFTLLGRVPVRGEIVSHPSGLEFEVLEADPRRVHKVKVMPKAA